MRLDHLFRESEREGGGENEAIATNHFRRRRASHPLRIRSSFCAISFSMKRIVTLIQHPQCSFCAEERERERGKFLFHFRHVESCGVRSASSRARASLLARRTTRTMIPLERKSSRVPREATLVTASAALGAGARAREIYDRTLNGQRDE